MAPEESTGQKTEKPTRRRRERAREQGEVAQSPELNSAFVLLASAGVVALFGGSMLQALQATMGAYLGHLSGPTLDMTGACSLASGAVRTIIRIALPLMVCTGLVGLACSIAQTGFLFAPKKLALNLGAINPIKGFKQLVSMRALVKLLMSLVKITAICMVAYYLLRERLDWLWGLTGKSPSGILFVSESLCLALIVRVGVVMLAVAVLDYAYQRWQFEKKLMMSKNEMRDEHRREEGDPRVRARQAQQRRAIARARMVQAVPTADVVVTNPTHVAIALKWNDKAMAAPKVIAKGQDYLAERIKQVARKSGVPVVERKILARALYEIVEVGMEIPPKLYYAVAEVLAFVLGRKKRRTG